MPAAPTIAADAKALADELARAKLVDSVRLAALLAEFAGGDAAALVAHLERAGALTPYQAARAIGGGGAKGLVVGPYRITGAPERGTFGPLFPAVHSARPQPVLLHAHPVRNLWRARQAKQFARALAAAGAHPAVLPLVDADSAHGVHFLVWPRADGARLADLVDEHGPLPADDVAALLGHAAGALAAAHAAGAPHGALTPRALAVAPTGLPLILELGAGALLAQALADDECMFDTMSAASASALVLAFAAPELCADPDARTGAADQYALGAVGYFAVTGLHPYPHPALPDLIRAKRAGAPPSAAVVNPDVPAEFAALLERMMAPDPAARFPNFSAVEQVLADLATKEPAPAAPPPALESLFLSTLGAPKRDSGTVKWDASASGALEPPARDGSDASVTFDLPEAMETLPDPPRVPEPAAPSAPAAPVFRAPRTSDAPPTSLPDAPQKPKRPDPRLAAPNPVQWHTQAAEAEARAELPPAAPKPSGSVWGKLKRGLAFWKAQTEELQVSVFGPAGATPGQSVKLTVFVHVPSTADNVRVLARAFQHDADLIGTGFLTREVARAAQLAVHLSVANAGVGQAQQDVEWHGQPKRLVYELHVPWESPEGPAPGLVSVGTGDVRIGKIEFRLQIRARKA
jgi:serine/threonine protein kinase